eukprot:11054002-Alexandrium_andersonii.AAC.1
MWHIAVIRAQCRQCVSDCRLAANSGRDNLQEAKRSAREVLTEASVRLDGMQGLSGPGREERKALLR